MITEYPLFGKVEVLALIADIWVPLVADATGLSIHRGGVRDGLSVKQDVGLCTFTLLDAHDPMDSGVLKPGLPLKVVTESGAPIFAGQIAYLGSTYPLNKATGVTRVYTTVTAADAVQTHVSTPRYGVTSEDGFETFEARIERLALSANAPVAVPDVEDVLEVYGF